jgi:hypothetical protein
MPDPRARLVPGDKMIDAWKAESVIQTLSPIARWTRMSMSRLPIRLVLLLGVSLLAAMPGRAAEPAAKPADPATEATPRPDALKPDAFTPEAIDQPEAAKLEKPLAYIAISGAPGDGDTSLTAALTKRLAALGVGEGSAQSANIYSIEGIVDTGAAGKGWEGLRIVWRIFGPDGTMLGGVEQIRLVRKGSLDKRWGAMADNAAREAAYKIAKLITP